MSQRGLWLACVIGAIGCGPSGPQITLATILSLSGANAFGGQSHLLAVNLAVDEINAAAGVLGSRLVVVNEDDHPDETRAGDAATKLISAYHPPAILGAIRSANTIRIAQVAAPSQVTVISGSSTSPELTGLDPYVFRTCSSDALQGKLLARRARDRGLTRAAVMHVPGPYGSQLADAFATNFAALGGSVTLNLELAEGQASYADELSQVFTSGPEAVLLVAYVVDGAQIIRDYNSRFSFQGTFWFFTDSVEDVAFVQGVGPTNFSFLHEGTGIAIPTGPALTLLSDAFSARYKRPLDSADANWYDAAYLVALALEEAGASDGTAVRDHLRSVATPPGTAIGPQEWAAARAAIHAGTDVNYEGASGSVDLDAAGDVNAPYDVWKVQNGQLFIVETEVRP